MSKDRFAALFEKQLKKAGAFGVRPPVLATLSPDSNPAAAMFTDMYAEPLKPGEGDYDERHGRLVTWSMADATRLLRTHGGLAGRLVVNLLEAPPVRPDFWWLQVGDEVIGPTAFRGGRTVTRSYALFDRLPFSVCRRCAGKRHLVGVRVPVPGGREVVVRGPDGTRAGRASALAHIAAHRSVPSATADGATDLADLPVTDEELALILGDFYADAPDVVAEALDGLRRADHRGGRWLARTLRARPELRRLSARVKRLAG